MYVEIDSIFLSKMQPTFTAWLESLNTGNYCRGKKHRDSVRNLSSCYCMAIFTLVALC